MQSLVRRWGKLQPRERAIALFVTAGLIAAVAIAAILERDTRVALFAVPQRPDQVAEVADRLAQWNVAFVETVDNVRVEAAKRNDLLLRLALVGVPHSHLESSADVLAKAGPLTPQSVLDAQATEGLAGDLAAGLRKISGVQDAQVIIAPAVDGAFADEASHAASASVRLSLEPGVSLARDALEGVRAFVAAGVPGLDPKHVAILDDRGLALGAESAPGSDEGQSLQQSLQSALDLALGAGATIVRVRVSYDPRVRELHDVTRKPIGSRAIGTTTSDEHYKSASKQYEKTNAAVDRGSVVEDERVDTPAGRLERISVAIAVDARRHLDLEKIRSLARGTLGLVSSRGDVVSVEEVAFPHDAFPLRNGRFASAIGLVETLAPLLVFSLAFSALAWFGAKPVARAIETVASRIALQRTARAVVAFVPAHVRGVLQNEPPHTAAAIISALPTATATAVLEMYPAEERAAIVRRMSRGAAPVIPDYETIARRG
jgi:flagellar biosynthesis/type III secretory pathway M-ring protein FliF/YscJ